MLDLGLVRGLIALITLATFLGICWWAYRPKNRSRFKEDALLVFDDEERARAKQSERAEEKRSDESDQEGAE
jgi:cytochrome c oxidase cbb3-type subunit 4